MHLGLAGHRHPARPGRSEPRELKRAILAATAGPGPWSAGQEMERRAPEPTADLAALVEALQNSLREERAKSVRLGQELVEARKELTEALEHQTATSEILHVISRSQSDLQLVFDTILTSAVRLLRGHTGTVTRLTGDQIDIAAHTSVDDAGDASLRAIFPQSLHSELPHAQAIRQRAPINIGDTQSDPGIPEPVRASARARGYHGWVTVPMLRQERAVGTIAVTRSEAGGFTDEEIALLQTFADQAVIAIENARLFRELQASNHELTDALARQTATSDVLRVVSRSQTDVQPVFEAILESAVRLCAADLGGMCRVENGQLVVVAFNPSTPEFWAVLRESYPRPADTTSLTGRAVVERRIIQGPDVDAPGALVSLTPVNKGLGFRSQLTVPILRDGEPVGVFSLQRRAPGPFSDAQIELVQTFADQAVIAIENARLLGELQRRTTDLTRSVEQLTALGEVGRAVGSTLDLEMVLTTIVSRAVQLSRLDGGVVFEYDEHAEEFTQRAAAETGGVLAQARRGTRYRKGEGVVGRTAITLEPVQVPDISVPGAYVGRMRDNLIESGIRALLAVPMVREDRLIGCLVVSRNRPGDFAAEIIELLRTFATQSALATQNARLFQEIADKSRQLEVASQHKSEFLANMSHELRTPLNAILGFSEVLAQGMFGEVNDKQAEYLRDILESGRHLLSLINDILDLSKIEAGRMELELSEFDLPQAIQNALMLVRERALRRGIGLHHAIDDRVASIRADERKVKQVLLNLLSNAIKFTPEGGRIEVRAAPTDGAVAIAVADTGVGIAPEDLEAVFEEFRQVGTADRKAEGTGLGLALARKFIELHGGRIGVTSRVGEGSIFTVTLPARCGP